MVFGHLVKYNGKYYPAGTNVPVGAVNVEKSKADNAAGKVIDDVAEITDKKYTKTEINRMPTAELKDVALLNGISDAENMTGAELKKILIDKLCL